MKIYFDTRKLARESKIVQSGKGKVVDCGTDKPIGRRWSVDVPMKSPKSFFGRR